ncbi:hypothetical protein I7I48_12189 [Histoplasma ohiense]|nr:hypothetical protein I7I48_12189 [Histoplasma ohiense (nom. inval.)]
MTRNAHGRRHLSISTLASGTAGGGAGWLASWTAIHEDLVRNVVLVPRSVSRRTHKTSTTIRLVVESGSASRTWYDLLFFLPCFRPALSSVLYDSAAAQTVFRRGRRGKKKKKIHMTAQAQYHFQGDGKWFLYLVQ